MKRLDLERYLREQGCVPYREGVGHSIWLNPAQHKIVSVPRHREIKEGTVRAICKQREIPQPRSPGPPFSRSRYLSYPKII